MSRVSALQDTRLALDIFENTATFAYRMMNENKMDNSSKNLNSFEKYV